MGEVTPVEDQQLPREAACSSCRRLGAWFVHNLGIGVLEFGLERLSTQVAWGRETGSILVIVAGAPETSEVWATFSQPDGLPRLGKAWLAKLAIVSMITSVYSVNSRFF